MTIFVSSYRNKLTKKYAKKNGTPCNIHIIILDDLEKIVRKKERERRLVSQHKQKKQNIVYKNSYCLRYTCQSINLYTLKS